MTTVMIHDDATRRVLTSCIWRAAHMRLGEGTWDHLWSTSQEVAVCQDDADSIAAVEETLSEVAAMLSALSSVRDAEAGSSIDMALSPDEWRDGIEGVRYSIEEGGSSFFHQPVEKRLQVLANRDAAFRLIEELGLQVAA